MKILQLGGEIYNKQLITIINIATNFVHVDFTNVLHAPFTLIYPKSAKRN